MDHVKSEWDTLKAAPMIFVGVLVLSLGAGFAGGLGFKGQEVSNLETLMRLKDGELDTYRKGIEERLGAVEKQMSAQQLSSFESVIKGRSGVVQLHAWPDASDDLLFNQFKGAFQGSGWSVTPNMVPYNWPAADQALAIISADAKSGPTISTALDAAKVSYELRPASDGIDSIEFWVKGAASPSPQTSP